jgi:transposase-like protein
MAETHFSTDGPICPYCKHEHKADEPYYYDEEMTRMDCDACERDFDVRVHVRTSWSTQERQP